MPTDVVGGTKRASGEEITQALGGVSRDQLDAIIRVILKDGGKREDDDMGGEVYFATIF